MASRRSPYYGATPPQPPARAAPALSIVSAASDGPSAPDAPVERLSGAAAIAARLGITERQFYGLARRRGLGMPVKKQPVLGFTADAPVLDAWWKRFVRGEIG